MSGTRRYVWPIKGQTGIFEGKNEKLILKKLISAGVVADLMSVHLCGQDEFGELIIFFRFLGCSFRTDQSVQNALGNYYLPLVFLDLPKVDLSPCQSVLLGN